MDSRWQSIGMPLLIGCGAGHGFQRPAFSCDLELGIDNLSHQLCLREFFGGIATRRFDPKPVVIWCFRYLVAGDHRGRAVEVANNLADLQADSRRCGGGLLAAAVPLRESLIFDGGADQGQCRSGPAPLSWTGGNLASSDLM
jgi:hypothetical protein